MKVGIFGVGTVGTGVVELMCRDDLHFEIQKAFVRNKNKKRDGIPSHIKFVDSINEILDDPEIELVIEVMGGTTLAWDIIRKAITNNKHVVTANKACLSKKLSSIQLLLKQHPHVQFGLDAAICGGIPIVPTIQRLALTDSILSIIGIMNGTCNYIVSSMSSDQEDFKAVLKKAQDLGFAEADPSNDIMGWDTRSKLCILVKIAFGIILDEDKMLCQGIDSVTQTDLMYGKMLNHTVKLLGYAQIQTNRETGAKELEVSVWPSMVPLNNPLASINGETNAIAVKSRNLGDTSLFIGPGAGRYPTANSVVADACQIYEKQKYNTSNEHALCVPRSEEVTIADDFVGIFYLRFVVKDRVGIIQAISTELAKHGVMINSILQLPIIDTNNVPFALITEHTPHSKLKVVCEDFNSNRLEIYDFLLEPVVLMRCLT